MEVDRGLKFDLSLVQFMQIAVASFEGSRFCCCKSACHCLLKIFII